MFITLQASLTQHALFSLSQSLEQQDQNWNITLTSFLHFVVDTSDRTLWSNHKSFLWPSPPFSSSSFSMVAGHGSIVWATCEGMQISKMKLEPNVRSKEMNPRTISSAAAERHSKRLSVQNRTEMDKLSQNITTFHLIWSSLRHLEELSCSGPTEPNSRTKHQFRQNIKPKISRQKIIPFLELMTTHFHLILQEQVQFKTIPFQLCESTSLEQQRQQWRKCRHKQQPKSASD